MNERIQQLDHWMRAREDEHLEFKEAKQGYDFEERTALGSGLIY